MKANISLSDHRVRIAPVLMKFPQTTVYWADIVIKKIFFLKLFYAFVFWLVIHKAGYFLSWFVSYLKEKKNEHHEYHDHHDHYSPHQYYEYGPPGSYGPPGHYVPYRRQSHGV
ncbi:unnamed protein product, partial [Iphiclides podalirius]